MFSTDATILFSQIFPILGWLTHRWEGGPPTVLAPPSPRASSSSRQAGHPCTARWAPTPWHLRPLSCPSLPSWALHPWGSPWPPAVCSRPGEHTSTSCAPGAVSCSAAAHRAHRKHFVLFCFLGGQPQRRGCHFNCVPGVFSIVLTHRCCVCLLSEWRLVVY